MRLIYKALEEQLFQMKGLGSAPIAHSPVRKQIIQLQKGLFHC